MYSRSVVKQRAHDALLTQLHIATVWKKQFYQSAFSAHKDVLCFILAVHK